MGNAGARHTEAMPAGRLGPGCADRNPGMWGAWQPLRGRSRV